MSEALKNPELPPGAIFKTLPDGRAMRNDGVMLDPASKNPWYVLATVAGEQLRGPDFEGNFAKNRRFWNGWMCQDMEEGARSALALNLDLPEEDLAPLTAEEIAAVKVRFQAAFPETAPEEMIPAPEDTVNFRRVYFSNILHLRKSIFIGYVDFREAHFEEIADFEFAHFISAATFEAAYFKKDADLRQSYFARGTDFQAVCFASTVDFRETHVVGDAVWQGAKFTGTADFQGARLTEAAVFQGAFFIGWAEFQKAFFGGNADFQQAQFIGTANFEESTFEKGSNFSDGCFKAQTVFDGATFKGEAPRFFHREMHQDTAFTDDAKLWPEVTAENAQSGKRAYTRLRQVAAEIYDPDLEHFFLRQEMRCKARIEWDKGAWFHWLFFEAYRVIADSGISVARPFWLLVFAWAFGFACFAGYFDSGVLPDLPEDIQDSRYWAAAGVSFGNLFGFLGINRLYFTEVLQDHSPDGLQFVAGAQTVAGVVLLFFLGLGLRNRFRLK